MEKLTKQEKELLKKYYNASLEAKAQGLIKAYSIMNDALKKGREIAEKQQEKVITEQKQEPIEVIIEKNKLTEKQKELWQRYNTGKETQTEIAKSLGVSQAAICKQLKVIMKRL